MMNRVERGFPNIEPEELFYIAHIQFFSIDMERAELDMQKVNFFNLELRAID